MKTGKIVFYECYQDSQDYGSNDHHMVSRVFFNLTVGDETFEGLYVDIKQTVGTDYNEPGWIEVGKPEGYTGNFNSNEFTKEVEGYYQDLIGKGGRSVKFGPGANVRMRDCLHEFTKEVQITIPD